MNDKVLKNLKRVMLGFYKLKLRFNRTDSYIGLFLDIASKLMLLATFLKVFEFYSVKLMVLISLLGLTVYFVVGHYDIKYKLIELETSFLNSYNPEIRKILENSNKNGKD